MDSNYLTQIDQLIQIGNNILGTKVVKDSPEKVIKSHDLMGEEYVQRVIPAINYEYVDNNKYISWITDILAYLKNYFQNSAGIYIERITTEDSKNALSNYVRAKAILEMLVGFRNKTESGVIQPDSALPSSSNMKSSLSESCPSFEKMVDEDINRCNEYLSGDKNGQVGFDLHFELTTKYPPYISRFGESLYNYSNEFGFNGEYFDQSSMINNLTVIKNKLVAFKNFGYKNANSYSRNNGIKIENTLTATQTQTMTISFEEVKNKIRDMSALSDSDTTETLEKIDEIKAIVELKDTPKTKWQKIKPILGWIADKSVDVGIALLPLILKIGS